MDPEGPADLVFRLRAAGCVFAEDEAALLVEATADATLRESLVARRVAGEPLEYVLGWAKFGGLRVAVGPGVFVPRVRTELLAEAAAGLARPGSVVLDLCCGSGALGAVVADRVPGVELVAADLDPAAVAWARVNLTPYGAQVFVGDLYAALPGRLRGRVDVLVANAPYVPSEAIALMPREARLHEAHAALDGGADGLAVLTRVIRSAPDWLADDGHLLVETSEAQTERAAATIRAVGLRPEIRRDDDRGATAVLAHR